MKKLVSHRVKKGAERLFRLMMAAVMVLGMLTVSASAADIELPTNVRAYPSAFHDLKQKRIWVFYDEELTNRSEAQWVGLEEVKVLDFSFEHGSVLIEYNTPNGKMKRWTDMRIIFPTTDPNCFQKMTAQDTANTYKDPGCDDRYGSVSTGDICWVCTTPQSSSVNYRVLYPLSSGGYKAGWVDDLSAFRKVSYTPSNASNNYVSNSEINAAAAQAGISTNTNAYKALQSINTEYASQLSNTQKKGTVVFMFEGVGSNSDSNKRLNAMCVVVENGQIDYINCNSSTLPDYPFTPSKNGFSDMPTLKSGIYSTKNWNHNGSYAALKVTNAAVVRFANQNKFYEDTSSGINVHRRSTNTIAGYSKDWVNSAGCLLVGSSGKQSTGEYARFIQSLGLVDSSARGDELCSSKFAGTLVVDRSYARDYMRDIGYSDAAIDLIG